MVNRQSLPPTPENRKLYELAIRKNANKLGSRRDDVWATFYHLLPKNTNPRHRLCPLKSDTQFKYVKSTANNQTNNHLNTFTCHKLLRMKQSPTLQLNQKQNCYRTVLRESHKIPTNPLTNLFGLAYLNAHLLGQTHSSVVFLRLCCHQQS